jgi:hypothetical protein
MTKDEEFFEMFWSAFPRGRKTKKADARRLFKSIVSGKHRDLKATGQELVGGALRYGLAMGEQHPYVMMPSTWLNGGCWEDDDLAPPEPLLLPSVNNNGCQSALSRQRTLQSDLIDRSWANSTTSRDDDHGR